MINSIERNGIARCLFGVAGAVIAMIEPAPSSAQPLEKEAAPLRFMTEHRPPNNYLDKKSGEIVGENADLLRQVLKRAGVKARFELAVWSRSYGVALTNADACAFSTVRNLQREALFKWVGPLDSTAFVMVSRQGAGIKIENVEQARPYRIGVFTQDVRAQNLRRLGGFNLDVAATDFLNARKLIERRIDLWYTDLESLAEVEPSLREQMEIVLREPPKQLYLACNKGVPDRVVDALNRALKALRAEAK